MARRREQAGRRETPSEWVQRARAFRARHGRTVHTWLVFLVIYAVLELLLRIFRAPVMEWAALQTAKLTAAGLGLLGESVTRDGVFVHVPRFSIEVIDECTAIFPALLFAAAVLAHPVSTRARLLGLALGLPLLALLNALRLVALCFVGRTLPEHFDHAHIVVGQSLIVFATVLLFLGFLTLASRRPTEPADA